MCCCKKTVAMKRKHQRLIGCTWKIHAPKPLVLSILYDSCLGNTIAIIVFTRGVLLCEASHARAVRAKKENNRLCTHISQT